MASSLSSSASHFGGKSVRFNPVLEVHFIQPGTPRNRAGSFHQACRPNAPPQQYPNRFPASGLRACDYANNVGGAGTPTPPAGSPPASTEETVCAPAPAALQGAVTSYPPHRLQQLSGATLSRPHSTPPRSLTRPSSWLNNLNPTLPPRPSPHLHQQWMPNIGIASARERNDDSGRRCRVCSERNWDGLRKEPMEIHSLCAQHSGALKRWRGL